MAKTAILSGAQPRVSPGGTTPRTPRCVARGALRNARGVIANPVVLLRRGGAPDGKNRHLIGRSAPRVSRGDDPPYPPVCGAGRLTECAGRDRESRGLIAAGWSARWQKPPSYRALSPACLPGGRPPVPPGVWRGAPHGMRGA